MKLKKGRSNTAYTPWSTRGLGGAKSIRMPPSSEHPLPSGSTSLVAGQYYRPESPTFPTIDVLILIKLGESDDHLLLILQITRNNATHDAKEKGLLAVKKLVVPEGTKKLYIAVTPDDLNPTITIRTACLKRLGKGRPEDVFPVYHYPVKQDALFGVPNLHVHSVQIDG